MLQNARQLKEGSRNRRTFCPWLFRVCSELLESAEITDLYGKDGDNYNITLRCTYRASDRTLTEEEAKKEYAKAEKLLGV